MLQRIESAVLTVVAQNETVKPVEQEVATGDVKQEEVKSDVLITQSGEAVVLTYDIVKGEAQKLVQLDEHTEQKGFARAREIIIGYNVAELKDVPKENYPEIVAQFRKAILEWK